MCATHRHSSRASYSVYLAAVNGSSDTFFTLDPSFEVWRLSQRHLCLQVKILCLCQGTLWPLCSSCSFYLLFHCFTWRFPHDLSRSAGACLYCNLGKCDGNTGSSYDSVKVPLQLKRYISRRVVCSLTVSRFTTIALFYMTYIDGFKIMFLWVWVIFETEQFQWANISNTGTKV